MPDGEEPVVEPTLESLYADRPDLLELAPSGRVGAKSVSDEDDYLAVPELLQRAESGYEAVRPVSRVPGLFPLSADLTNEYLKQDDRRLPAQEEYLWMSCFGAHMAALFVALDKLLPYVPAANQDFTPYLARARNHAEAIDKAFRFRLAFLRRLNELQVADVDYEDVAVDAGVVAKVSTSDGVGRLSSELLELCEATFRSLTAQTFKGYAGRLSQFAEFCHDSENISPLEATTATVVRYVAWIGERGHIGAKSLQPYMSAINTLFEMHNLDPIAKDSLHLTSATRGLMLRQHRPETAPLCTARKAALADGDPTTCAYFSFRLRKGAASAANAIGVPLSHIRYQGGWATTSDVVLDYIDPNVLPSPGACFFFGHIAPLHHFQVQHDSAAVAFPVPPS
eukprot:jgi/Tetstr1/424735/TSEL_015252.t1